MFTGSKFDASQRGQLAELEGAGAELSRLGQAGLEECIFGFGVRRQDPAAIQIGYRHELEFAG